jgi:hypothetical protein
MALAVFSIIVGAIWFFNGFFVNAQSAIQQTVQYLSFVCGSIFLVGGFIMITIHRNVESNTAALGKISNESRSPDPKRKSYLDVPSNLTPVSGETWVCKVCSTRNPATATSCSGCGKYR